MCIRDREWISSNNIPEGMLVYGWGYDDSLLLEKRHPTRDDLDQASTSHPIVIRHVSGHLASANSLALNNNNINPQTPDPLGGVIRRRPENQEPNGVMEETAMSLLPGRDSLIARTRVGIYVGKQSKFMRVTVLPPYKKAT